MLKSLKNFRKCTVGAALIEWTFILPLLLAMTFGVIEFSYVMFQFSNVQKATQAGARVASTRAVLKGVPECFVDLSGNGNGNNNTNDLEAGTSCANFSSNNPDWSGADAMAWGGLTCSGVTDTDNCDGVGMTAILNEMQIFYPSLQASNLEVEFGPSPFGFVGRGRPVPTITVRATNLSYDYIAIGVLINFLGSDDSDVLGDSINITTAETTIIGEDMSEGA